MSLKILIWRHHQNKTIVGFHLNQKRHIKLLTSNTDLGVKNIINSLTFLNCFELEHIILNLKVVLMLNWIFNNDINLL